MIDHLGRWISEYGYLIVGLFIFAEGIAIPFPTDTTLVTAAAFAARGHLSLALVFLVSSVSATAGTTVAFLAGRRGGTFVERHTRRVNPAVLARTRGFFDRHGGSAVVIGRFVPVARMLISPMAGLSTMSLARFTAFNAVGAVIWSAVFCGVGYFFGQHPPAFGRGLARGAVVITLGLGVLAVVAMAGGWLVEESDAAWRAEGSLWHRILSTAPLRWLGAHSPRARTFMFRRFTPGDYLGLNLTLGLGLSFVALVIFGTVANALLARNAVPDFDLALARALRASATPAGDAFWRAVSSVGTLPALAVPGLTLAVLLAPRRGWLPFAGWASSLAGAALLDLTVKHFFVHAHGRAGESGAIVMGTPSGQALGALVGFGMVAYFVVLLVPGRRTGLVATTAAAMLIAACSFGRLYLGERYFSDVVSGLAAGGVWLAACLTGLEVARRRDERGTRQRPGRRRGST